MGIVELVVGELGYGKTFENVWNTSRHLKVSSGFSASDAWFPSGSGSHFGVSRVDPKPGENKAHFEKREWL